MSYPRPVRVRLQSIGCRLNSGEMDALGRALKAYGCRIVAPGSPADVCVLNTCTVTATAARKSRQAIRRIRRELPGCYLLVTGCDSELEPERALEAGANVTVPNADKDRVVELLRAAGVVPPLSSDIDRPQPEANDQELAQKGSENRTRVFVKVQDGCNNRCAYCVVTIARGEGKSRPILPIISEISDLVSQGFPEVVLTGVHLGSYGHDLVDGSCLATLVGTILTRTRIPRLRLSSVEPWDVTAELLSLFDDSRLMPHLHLPLQSGCDRTLSRMARKTSRSDYRSMVDKIRQRIPNVAISTDIMVGFPGETDPEFEESLRFVEELRFSSLHVFRFSPRTGTAASQMPDQVAEHIAQRRSEEMRSLGHSLAADFADTQIGLRQSVLWEECTLDRDSANWRGLTPNYLRVGCRVSRAVDLSNTITMTQLVGKDPNGELVGVIEPDTVPDSLHGDPSKDLPVMSG